MTAKQKRGLAKAATLGAAALAFSAGAHAADKELLDILLKNGAIDNKQYDNLMKKGELKAKDVAAAGNSGVTLDGKGLQIKSNDGNFTMKIGGRVHADAAWFDGGKIGNPTVGGTGSTTDWANTAGINRARIETQGTFYKDFEYKIQYDFASRSLGGASNNHIKDMWVKYKGLGFMNVAVGNDKRPFSLSQMMSSNDILFAERGLEYTFIAPDERAVGATLESHGDQIGHWTLAGGVYGGTIKDSNTDTKNKNDDGAWSTSARATWAPILDKDTLVHVGGSGSYRVPKQGAKSESYAFRPVSIDLSDNNQFANASISNVKDSVMGGVETALVYGPASLEAEYIRNWVNREDTAAKPVSSSLTFAGWRVDAAYSLTGESRAASYDAHEGKFKRLKPNRNFDLNGGWGAWELKARLHSLDLNDKEISGGKVFAMAAGVNWYMNSYLRLMADYNKVLDIEGGPTGYYKNQINSPASDLDYFMVRASLTF